MVAAVVAALAGIGLAIGKLLDADEGGEPARVPQATGGVQRERTSFLSRLIPPPPERPRGPRIPRSIGDLARRLPLERKVAQLFLFGFRGQDLTAPIYRQLRRLDVGGVVIANRNYQSPQQLASLAGEAAVVARQERHVPPWVVAAQEGGEFSEFPDLPPGSAPAAVRTPRGAGRAAFTAGRTLHALGLKGVLAPVLDVGVEQSAIGRRAFSDDPRAVAAFGVATIEGYRRARMLTTAKHFPGLGAATQDTAEGPAPVGLTVEELESRDLVPFRAAIRARAPAVMVGHGSYASDDFVTPASLSRAVVTGLLRERLRFRGLAVTDDLAAPAVTALSSVPDAAVAAIRAGQDMVFISGPRGDQEAAYLAVVDAARRNRIPRARIDQALLRALTAKRDFGLIR